MTKLDILEIGIFTIVIGKIFSDIIYVAIKNIINKTIGFLSSKIVSSITISGTKNETFHFDLFREWLSRHPYTKKCSSSIIAWSAYQKEYIKLPAAGNHIIFYNKLPLFVNFTEDDKGNKLYKISVLWFKSALLTNLMEDIKKFHTVDGKKDLALWVWSDQQWISVYGKQKRPLNTVYLDEDLRADILEDIKRFLKSKDLYDLRGQPYNRGYLLYGPPGTGKSSLALGLASELDLPVFALNLGTASDGDIQKILNVQSPCILLIEDVDRFNLARATGWKDENGKDLISMSLSGLLNAIDGIFSRCGRVLIMTTNHPEKLDPALIRSGRIDRRFEIGPLPPKETGKMFKVFYPNYEEFENIIMKTSIEYPRPAADWQGLFVQYQDAPDELFKAISDDIKKRKATTDKTKRKVPVK